MFYIGKASHYTVFTTLSFANLALLKKSKCCLKASNQASLKFSLFSEMGGISLQESPKKRQLLMCIIVSFTLWSGHMLNQCLKGMSVAGVMYLL